MALGPDTTIGGRGEFRSGTVRRVPGFFGVGQQMAGQWALLDGTGAPVFLRAVHGVRNEPVGSDAPIVPDAASRLRAWGFNAVGVGGDGAGRDDGLAFLAGVDFLAVSHPLTGPDLRLPDVFAPDWPAKCEAHAAARCGRLAGVRELIGWVSDEDLRWAQSAGEGRPGLLQHCLSLEPNHAAYHASWEFALALYPGGLDAMARGWGVPFANKEVVREMTRNGAAIVSRGYLRDDARWTREFARRYFAATGAAVRAADPNHLFLGCRFRGPAGAAVLAEAAYPAADLCLAHWTELPPPGTAGSGPVLAGDVAWTGVIDLSSGRPAQASRQARLTSVERMLRRGRASLRRLARHPAVVGYVWGHWHDEPGEQPPFARGLVHPGGAEAREHTELLSDFNVRAESIRRAAAKTLSP